MQPTSIYTQPGPQEFGLQSRGRSVSLNRLELLSKHYELGARRSCGDFQWRAGDLSRLGRNTMSVPPEN